MNFKNTYNTFRFGVDLTPKKEKCGYEIIEEKTKIDVFEGKDILDIQIKNEFIKIPSFLYNQKSLYSNVLSYFIAFVFEEKNAVYENIRNKKIFKIFFNLNFLNIPLFCMNECFLYIFIIGVLLSIFYIINTFVKYKDVLKNVIDDMYENQNITEIEKDIMNDCINNFSLWQSIWVYSPTIKLLYLLLRGKRLQKR